MRSSSPQSPTIAEIHRVVADHFAISVLEMRSERRARWAARPRQIAMYLARELTPHSLPMIARCFDRDHTTVMHAIRVVEALCAEDAAVALDVSFLRAAIGEGVAVEVVIDRYLRG